MADVPDSTELIPGKLCWNPALTKAAEGASGLSLGSVIRLSEFIGDEDIRGGEYRVQHYPPEVVGAAYGPLALDQTMAFCRVLDRADEREGMTVVATDTGSVSERANTAVLVGAYLLALRGWSAQQLADALPKERDIVFPCSWSKPGGKGTLTVRACWEGLEMARDLDWLPGDVLRDDFATKFVCTQYRRNLQEYDVAWLVPNAVLVAADPMTVIKDPNPVTCKFLEPVSMDSPVSPSRGADIDKFIFPSREATPIKQWVSSAEGEGATTLGTTTAGPAHSKSQEDKSAKGWRHEDETLDTTPGLLTTGFSGYLSTADTVQRDSESDDARTAHTVCKGYGDCESMDAVQSRLLVPAEDFITWCLHHNVGQITRVNFSREPGLKCIGGSYPEEIMRRHGIRHQDVPVNDYDGGVPPKKDFKAMLAKSSKLESRKALLVHCKGGFGRSVVMACSHIIKRFDVPGLPLLGWARIVRPGAITTVDQERFLAKLTGAEDLERFLGGTLSQCFFKFFRL